MAAKRIVIFDGVCNLCNGAVNFIIKRDSEARFLFTPMQSEYAQELIREYSIENVGADTFALVKDGRSYTQTKAALEIARELDGLWWMLGIARLIPGPIRDYVYRTMARNRYTLFGRTDACVVPGKEVRKRFIGIDS